MMLEILGRFVATNKKEVQVEVSVSGKTKTTKTTTTITDAKGNRSTRVETRVETSA